MQKITPFLWFDSQAEEAMNFYVSIFKNSKIGSTTRYDEAGSAAAGRPKESVMTISFNLDGQEFTAMNAGPVFKFNPSVSFIVITKDEKEIDDLWNKFSEGGKVLMELQKYDWSKKYGWVEDKYGLSWQVVPEMYFKLESDKNKAKRQYALNAVLKMKKIIIADLVK